VAKVKYTKSALRDQQHRLEQLERYLPTLQLKKAMLQAEVDKARAEIAARHSEFCAKRSQIEECAELLTDDRTFVDFDALGVISKVERETENIAGVLVPNLKKVVFVSYLYPLFDSPPWLEQAILMIESMVTSRVSFLVAREKESALKEELRRVSIRVNLFEKVLIPRTQKTIRRIRVFLGDQELAAISRAKVAKAKIEAHKEEMVHAH